MSIHIYEIFIYVYLITATAQDIERTLSQVNNKKKFKLRNGQNICTYNSSEKITFQKAHKKILNILSH